MGCSRFCGLQRAPKLCDFVGGAVGTASASERSVGGEGDLYGRVCHAGLRGFGWAEGAAGGPGMGGGGGGYRLVPAARQGRASTRVAQRRHLFVFKPASDAA